MYNLGQHQMVVGLSSHHNYNVSPSNARTLNFSLGSSHHHHQNTTNNKLDKILSPKKKKRKYNNISPIDNYAPLSLNSSAATKTITGDSFISTGCGFSPNQSKASAPIRTNSSSTRAANIVDRVMDIGKYSKNTPLYTMCRDWMNASTTLNENPKQISPKQHESKPSDNPNVVTSLPEPISSLITSDESEYDIDIVQLNENIKVNIRSNEESDLDLIKKLNVDEEIQTHALLKLHVNRWKLARREWFNYYNVKSKPYQNSYQTLKSIFEDIL